MNFLCELSNPRIQIKNLNFPYYDLYENCIDKILLNLPG